MWILSLLLICEACAHEAQPLQKPQDAKTKAVQEEKETPPEIVHKIKRIPLTLVIRNLRSMNAPVIVGLYRDNKQFLLAEGRLSTYSFKPDSKTITAQIDDQDFGEYAIAVFQDENNSGKMDKNILGLPTEGWCLSNNFRPNLKRPTYEDCNFVYNEKENTLIMEMVW